jgi:hypothetical protein
MEATAIAVVAGCLLLAAPAGSTGDVESYVELEERYDIAPGVYYRRVADFFRLRGHLFSAQIEFTEGAAREHDFRSILDHAVRSIKAIAAPAR